MIAAMIKSAIVLAIAACIASTMRRNSAAVRHTVWTAGLAGALAIPLFTLAMPIWRPEVLADVLAVVRDSTQSFAWIRPVAVAVWLGGAGIGILLLFHGAARLAWVAVRSEPVEDLRWAALADEVRHHLGIRRSVRLLQNRSVPYLGTWGVLAPRVLLPADSAAWSDDRIRMVLGHELAHIKRLDWVVQVLADAARAIYWFNPVFWLASSGLRRESERACDDSVIRMGTTDTRYAEELLAMTREFRSDQLDHPILSMAQPSHLEIRLVSLLNPSLNRLAATPWAVLVVAGFAIALTLPLAAVRSAETAPIVNTVLLPPPPALSEATGDKTPPPPPTPEREAPTVPASASKALGEVKAEPLKEVPPLQCEVTPSIQMVKTKTVEKQALGNGPWFINEDQTLWANDQTYVAGRAVTTIWMRPANTELHITARRLDSDAPRLEAGPAAPFETGFVGIGLAFPSAGCWEVTGTAGESTLTFITRVQD